MGFLLVSSCAQQTKLLNRSLYSEYLSEKNETTVGGAGTGMQIGRKTETTRMEGRH